jgi:hypothetical protein
MSAERYDILPSGTVANRMTLPSTPDESDTSVAPATMAAPTPTPAPSDTGANGESPAWLRPARRPRAEVIELVSVSDEPETIEPTEARDTDADAQIQAVADALQTMTARIDELASITHDLVRAQAALDERLTTLADEVTVIRRRTPVRARRQPKE